MCQQFLQLINYTAAFHSVDNDDHHPLIYVPTTGRKYYYLQSMFASRTRRTPPNLCSASDGRTTTRRGGGRSNSPPITKQAEHLNEMAAVKLLQISLLLFKWVPGEPPQSFFSTSTANRAASENYNIYFCGVYRRLIPIYWGSQRMAKTRVFRIWQPASDSAGAEINDNVGHAEGNALEAIKWVSICGWFHLFAAFANSNYPCI